MDILWLIAAWMNLMTAILNGSPHNGWGFTLLLVSSFNTIFMAFNAVMARIKKERGIHG